MSDTPNHGYNVPEEGEENWHVPLNDNFEAFDSDIEIRDFDANRGDYEPKEGAKFLATDTGIVYTGTGDDWEPTMVQGQYDEDGDSPSIVFETGDAQSVSIDGDIEVSGTKHFVEAVQTARGPREVVYTSAEAPTPRTEISGVARLEDGRAEIELPEHFGLVTAPSEPLVVQVTPYSSESDGLVVLERSLDQLVVADQDREGDYEFSYTVKGTRTGQTDKQVVRTPRETTAAPHAPARPTNPDDTGTDE